MFYFITEEDFYIRCDELRDKILDYKEKKRIDDEEKTPISLLEMDCARDEISMDLRTIIVDSEEHISTTDELLKELFNKFIGAANYLLLEDSIICIAKGNLRSAITPNEKKHHLEWLNEGHENFAKETDELLTIIINIMDRKTMKK